MPAPVVLRRFRTRLSAAFVLVAGVTAGLLALGTFLAIREYRYRTFTDQAENTARLGLLSVPADLSLATFQALSEEYRDRAGVETVAVSGELELSSSPKLGVEDIPNEMEVPSRGELESTNVTAAGKPYLLVGGMAPGGVTRLYFFFDRQDVLDSVRHFRNVVTIGWLASVALAAAAGRLVARRTLRPVARAADAAQSLAEGLLETRLPTQSDDEFGAWAQSFNRMAQALEDKIAALSQAAARERRFTANVAHDLRTPLTGMASAAALLDEELDSMRPEARRVAELIIDDVRRLEGLVLELLELARLDAGQDEVHVESISLREAVGAVLRSWDGETDVSATIDPTLAVRADRTRFKRVLSNLVANAVTHGGGVVEVTARRQNGDIAIDVLDRGPGLADADIDRVFDRFYKGDTARSGGGSGLGLAIALEHARAQGGTLEAANRAGGGARFSLRLPAVAKPTEACPEPATAEGTATAGQPGG
ncbi:MAG: HAMP domain-containing histidine kinase [Actinomycetota bacterium]|nr:HAMP domain-containing histidine kinase [Actinomycetota bacterium]